MNNPAALIFPELCRVRRCRTRSRSYCRFNLARAVGPLWRPGGTASVGNRWAQQLFFFLTLRLSAFHLRLYTGNERRTLKIALPSEESSGPCGRAF